MRTDREIYQDARPGAAFSNSTQFEIWAPRWCHRCLHDDEAAETYCPILTTSLAGVTPREWVTVGEVHADYTCTEFEEGLHCPRCDFDGMSAPTLVSHLAAQHSVRWSAPDDGPPPELPGQESLF